jgi:putative acetyltransferase
MYSIRPILTDDNVEIARLIRQVSHEFGLASDAGFAVSDPILDHLYEFYQQPHSYFLVIVDENNQILGGGGIAPLHGETNILEIQKMYFLPELRGRGLAQKLLEHCFEFARLYQFKSCYLETTASLSQSIQLYQKIGFVQIDQPKGNTGHSAACEIWMLKTL